ncbi:MAG: hypothetical protein DI535_00705 [Citrobacter freundii]|nr:MAG: hypothetical protein DI535_00705 [Citrobacter freundii]
MKTNIILLAFAFASLQGFAQNDKGCTAGNNCEKGNTPTDKANAIADRLGNGMAGLARDAIRDAISVRESTLIDSKPGPQPSPDQKSVPINGLIIFFTELDNEVRIYKKYNGGEPKEIYFASNHNTQSVNPEQVKTILLQPDEAAGHYTFIIQLTNLPNPGRNNPWAINGRIYSDATLIRPDESKFVQQIKKSSGGRSEEAFREEFIYNFDK